MEILCITKESKMVRWMGPAKVVFQDSKVVFVRHGGKYVTVSANFVKKATGTGRGSRYYKAAHMGTWPHFFLTDTYHPISTKICLVLSSNWTFYTPTPPKKIRILVHHTLSTVKFQNNEPNYLFALHILNGEVNQ